ncbi:MAG: type II CAAX endopeptidase family protein, partial [Gemmatimonadota bacterium]|nr:type II CAAX endopeptidase family protein [Gemmatimonadota bacterium]
FRFNLINKEEEMAYPNLKQSIWLLVLLVLIGAGLGIPVAILGMIIDQPLHKSPYAIWPVTLVSFVLVVHYVLRRTDRTWSSWSDIMPIKAISWQLLLPLVVSILGLLIVSLELGKVMMSLAPTPEGVKDTLRGLVGKKTSYWLAFYGAVIQTPIIEEALFRGIIVGGLLAYWSKYQAAIWSAILFGIYHLNPAQFPVAFILGLVFAWWIIQTGSLLPCILGHALNNFLAITLARSGIPGFKNPKALIFLPWWVVVCAVLLAAIGLWWFYQIAKRDETEHLEAEVEPERHC